MTNESPSAVHMFKTTKITWGRRDRITWTKLPRQYKLIRTPRSIQSCNECQGNVIFPQSGSLTTEETYQSARWEKRKKKTNRSCNNLIGFVSDTGDGHGSWHNRAQPFRHKNYQPEQQTRGKGQKIKENDDRLERSSSVSFIHLSSVVSNYSKLRLNPQRTFIHSLYASWSVKVLNPKIAADTKSSKKWNFLLSLNKNTDGAARRFTTCGMKEE